MSEVKEHITCAEAIFCPSWGEYKVAENNVVISARLWNVNIYKVRNITITNPDECAFCGLYKKGKPSIDCHCKVCEERRASND